MDWADPISAPGSQAGGKIEEDNDDDELDEDRDEEEEATDTESEAPTPWPEGWYDGGMGLGLPQFASKVMAEFLAQGSISAAAEKDNATSVEAAYGVVNTANTTTTPQRGTITQSSLPTVPGLTSSTDTPQSSAPLLPHASIKRPTG